MNYNLKFNMLPIRTDPFIKYFLSVKPFNELSLDGFPDKIIKSFSRYAANNQYSYIFEYNKQCIIEPGLGWCITLNDELLEASVPYALERNIPRPNYLKYKFLSQKKIRIDTVISLRYGIENYWHFFNDIIGSLIFLYDHGYPDSIPLLVPEKILKKDFFNEFKATCKWASGLHWIFQKEEEYFECNKVILAKNIPFVRSHFTKLMSLCQVDHTSNIHDDKIFLVRGLKRNRRLANQLQVELFLKSRGFKSIDTDQLSFSEQIKIFRNCRFLIGIHGAGLTNIIYRLGMPLNLVEILPENIMSPHYFWMCSELGYNYVPVLGTIENASGEFEINIKELNTALEGCGIPT